MYFVHIREKSNLKRKNREMYKKDTKKWLKHADFIIIDFVCLQLSMAVAYFIRFGFGNPYADDVYRNVDIVAELISLFVIIYFETMQGILKRGKYQEFVKTLHQVVLVSLLNIGYLYIVHRADVYSRTVMIWSIVLYFAFDYSFRLIWKNWLNKRGCGTHARSLLLVTVSERAERCVVTFEANNYEKFHVAGLVILDDDKVRTSVHGIPVVASGKTLIEYVRGAWVDEVLVDVPDDLEGIDILKDKLYTMGIVVHRRLINVVSASRQRQFVENVGGFTVLTTSINCASPLELLCKRLLDILGGLVGTALTGVLCLVMVPVIKTQSPGPVFFTQERVGKNGKRFQIYKFRTMYMDAEERKKELMEQNRVKDGMMFKIDFDPRIIGNKVLPDGTQKSGFMDLARRLSLDEFPQFLNVLKGDMSLVGTRPPTVDEYEKYQLHHHARLATKPGITGMWQVSGRSNITDFEEVVRLDTKYIQEWTYGLDIRILLRTVAVVLKREGSM